MVRPSYSREVAPADLYVAVFISILAVEVVRWAIHPAVYEGRWVAVIVFSGILNIAYHVWSLPDTYAKTILSATYNQFTMPHFGALLWVFVVELAVGAINALRRLIPAFPG